ncbi:FAR1-related sequence 5-like protein [Tanacetum coccineum]
MKTPRATLYEQKETPGGLIYWVAHVEGIPIPVEGTWYDTVDEAIDMYSKYAKMRGFEVKKAGQRLTKSGVHAHTKRVQTFYKETRKMTEAEKMFVVKAATNKIGATRAHNLLSSMKGGYEYVHGTTDDFKNHQRDYRVENSELVLMFWADEVAKCNYKEFGDIVSFDATFNNNNYNMKFVPFIDINNHGKCVTLGSGMLLHEDTKSYTWLLTAFMTAFLKEPTMIVTAQDGAMKRAIKAVFTKAKHILCMWHIMQKIPSKIPAYFVDSSLFGLMRTTSRSESENSFFKSFTSPGATLVSFLMSYESAMERQRDKNPKDNTTLNTKKGKEQENKSGTVAEIARDYKVLRIIEAGSVALGHRDIIPTLPDRRQRNRNGEKNKFFYINGLKKTTNEANFLVDDSLFLLSKDERRMGTYVEKLKILLDEVKADMLNPASRNTGDVIGGIFSISKPNQVDVKNPTKAVNKGEHLKNGECLKSEREKAIKVKAKAMKVCGYCQEKTNEHTKTTCPKNPKVRKKKKVTPIIDV